MAGRVCREWVFDMASSTSLIELDNVRKSYNLGLPNEAEVLHGVDLRVARGEFMALIGPSGSGKSTLLGIIGLLERMTSGRYLLQGEEVQGLDDAGLTLRRRSTLGFVFQFHHLLPALVLADEPTGNLDTASSDEVFVLLRRMHAERGTSFVLVTHDPRLAARCDRTVELIDGRIAKLAASGETLE